MSAVVCPVRAVAPTRLAVIALAMFGCGPSRERPGVSDVPAAQVDRDDCGEGPACRAAALDAIGRGDDGRALRFATRSCTRGHLPGCKTLGWLHENGRGTARDPRRAREIYGRACDAGDPGSCKSLGLLLDTGGGGGVDRTRAAALYTRACEGGELEACNNLANLCLAGQGVPRDLERAAALYDRVCAATGRPRACANARAVRAMHDGGAAR